MSLDFYADLDRLIFTASEVQRQMPIEPGRLQMLMKRHFPSSEAAQKGRGYRRPYTPRMIIWIAFTNQLMNLGMSMGLASRLSRFAFSGSMDADFRQLAASDDPESVRRIGRQVAVYRHVAGREPAMSLVDFDAVRPDGAKVLVPFGLMLLELAWRFKIAPLHKS